MSWADTFWARETEAQRVDTTRRGRADRSVITRGTWEPREAPAVEPSPRLCGRWTSSDSSEARRAGQRAARLARHAAEDQA